MHFRLTVGKVTRAYPTCMYAHNIISQNHFFSVIYNSIIFKKTALYIQFSKKIKKRINSPNEQFKCIKCFQCIPKNCFIHAF